MKWARTAALAMATLAAAALGGLSCTNDNGEPLTLEEYFERVEKADTRFNDKSETIFDSVDPAEPDDAKDAFRQLSGLLDEFLDELEGMDPPAEARDVHDRGVEAGREAQRELDDLLDKADDSASLEELFSSGESEAFEAAGERFEDLCRDLVEIAEDNDIEVALNCEDDA